MHSALFVADLSKKQPSEDFLQGLQQKRAQVSHAVRLAENVWMVPFRDHPGTLGWMIATAERTGCEYALLPFEDAPQWLAGALDPVTIRDRNAGW